tara:strand:- start:104 stop:415 length:312 start_codon:yes stop_codon:yes gene_type:complete
MLIEYHDKDQEKIKQEDVVVIQYSASWCAPCRSLKPVMEKMSEEFKDKAKFFYADIDEAATNSAAQDAVRGVPTVVVKKKGQETMRFVGGMAESKVREFFQKL